MSESSSSRRAPLAGLNDGMDVPRVSMRIGSEWRDGSEFDQVFDPFGRRHVASVPRSTGQDLDDALRSANAARKHAAAMPAYERAAMLHRAADGVAKRGDELAFTLARETGKALKDAKTEVARSVETLRLSGDEAIRITGEHVPLDGSALGAGKLAMLLRFPIGVVAAITPFNAPLNLTVHKVGPALAAGNSVVLKPPPQAALTVHRLVEEIIAAGVPSGMLNTVYGPRIGADLVRDDRVDLISFTGSVRAGLEIRASCGLKRVALELGGIGPTIVHSDADVPIAAALCAKNGMRLAGQSCVSVQIVYVHASIEADFTASLVREVQRMKVGDPVDPETDVGPLIDECAAIRIEQWVGEAVAAGAKVLTGGSREGAFYTPTVLVDVNPAMKVVCEEVFGPLISIVPYDDVDRVFESISESRFGLQCGLFTNFAPLAIRAIRSLRTGGLIVNGTSTWRPDQLPYGGVKDSGIGREGPHYAIRDMTEERLVVFDF